MSLLIFIIFWLGPLFSTEGSNVTSVITVNCYVNQNCSCWCFNPSHERIKGFRSEEDLGRNVSIKTVDDKDAGAADVLIQVTEEAKVSIRRRFRSKHLQPLLNKQLNKQTNDPVTSPCLLPVCLLSWDAPFCYWVHQAEAWSFYLFIMCMTSWPLVFLTTTGKQLWLYLT